MTEKKRWRRNHSQPLARDRDFGGAEQKRWGASEVLRKPKWGRVGDLSVFKGFYGATEEKGFRVYLYR